jgi:hypothetical protein
MKKVYAKMVPKKFISEQKMRRKETCSYLSEKFEQPDLLEEIVFQYDLETKHRSFQWKIPESLETEGKCNCENQRSKQF